MCDESYTWIYTPKISFTDPRLSVYLEYIHQILQT
jgi:hypothetical protein